MPANCRQTLLDLVQCAADGSLATSNGCCTTNCAARIQKALKAGCINVMLTTACKTPAAQKYKVGLFNTARRCAHYKASC